jgi:hypothetical protein
MAVRIHLPEKPGLSQDYCSLTTKNARRSPGMSQSSAWSRWTMEGRLRTLFAYR